MDHIKSQLDRLSDLNDEQVSELQASIVSEFEQYEGQAPTPETVDAMTQLADMFDTLNGEVQRREAQAEELAARAAEATSRIKGEQIVEEVVGDDPIPEQEESEEFPETPAVEEEVEEDAEKVASTGTESAAEFANAEPVVTEAAVEETPSEEPTTEATEAATEPEPEVTEAVAEEPEATPTTEEATEASEDTNPEAEATAEAPAEAEASNSEINPSIEQNAQEEAPVTAAATEPEFSAPADRRPVAKAIEAPVAITAGADIQGYTAGSELKDMVEVATAMQARLRSIRNVNGGDGEQLIVASIRTEYPEDRQLSADDFAANEQKIKKVVAPEALMASGGFAAPLNVTYDIPGLDYSDARPVRDALPRFQADRGGIRYVVPPVLNSYVDAVGIWTNDNDVDALGHYTDPADPEAPVKNLLIVGGATTDEELTYAVTLQLQFGNFMTRAWPELIARHNELALVQHSRQAELALLSKINAKSTQITAGSTLGFARDFLSQVRRVGVQYRSRNRLDREVPMRAIIPIWIIDAMAADLAMQMPGDNTLGIGRAEVEGYLRDSNITLVESLDQGVFGPQNAGALLDWPATFTWYLFPEGTFLFLDGGTLDLGIIRDSGLVGTNDYRMFTETFEGLAKVGSDSFAITSTVRVNGAAAALIPTTPPVV